LLHSEEAGPNSEESPALSSLLVIAPVGIYVGRVRKGIDLVLGSQTKAKETKVKVILVSGQNWIQSDQSYKAQFVDKVKDYVLGTWKRTGELDIVCDDVILPIDEEEYLTGWLLKELSAFFKASPGEAEAFIDLTSAPKEWQLATINVLNFFPRIELYYVKPKYERQPKDYDKTEIEDEGHPKLQTVRTGEARQPLPYWTEPTTDKRELNIQYLLFETIFRLAQSIAVEKGLDPLKELHKVWVPIEERRGIDEYKHCLEKCKHRLPREFHGTLSDDSRLKKSVSKCLTAVDIFRLFEVKGKSVRMTLRAAMLGQTLFAGRAKGI